MFVIRDTRWLRVQKHATSDSVQSSQTLEILQMPAVEVSKWQFMVGYDFP